MTEIDPRAEEIRINENVAPPEQNVDLSKTPAPYGIDVMVAAGLELLDRVSAGGVEQQHAQRQQHGNA